MEVALSTAINVISLGIITSGALIIIGNPDGNFTIGNLTEYVSYFSTLIWPIMAISQLINMASQGYASLGRINKLFNEEPSVKSKENAIVLDKVQGKIEFKNLSFTYPTLEHNILSNVSFTINPGEKIGIIGKTGSGKTTIVDLLLRMYNVEEGQLFIDDIDIMDLDVKHLRENITFVPQDNFLFGTKIKDNIAFGQDASFEEVEKVSKMADIHKDIVDFTDGYDTILGERGVTVSGGQKQRISIARALLKKAPIIILDDAVSAVDTKTEDNILNNLKEHYQDATIIITAHRISTVQDLDKVLVIEEGRVVGFGTHNDLYANNEVYKEMVDLQKLEAKIEGDLNGTN
jgi:ATP-binding cassette subfamily B protein